MPLESFQEKILQQLITQEMLLSKLYAIFSEQFPKYEVFWQNLSKEEKRHAKIIEKLYEAAKKGSVFFDEGKIKTYTLNAFIERLESLVERAQRNEFNLAAAFAHAVDYETSLIEKNVFVRFDSLNEKIKSALNVLQNETLDHTKRIRQERDRLKH